MNDKLKARLLSFPLNSNGVERNMACEGQKVLRTAHISTTSYALVNKVNVESVSNTLTAGAVASYSENFESIGHSADRRQDTLSPQS